MKSKSQIKWGHIVSSSSVSLLNFHFFVRIILYIVLYKVLLYLSHNYKISTCMQQYIIQYPLYLENGILLDFFFKLNSQKSQL